MNRAPKKPSASLDCKSTLSIYSTAAQASIAYEEHYASIWDFEDALFQWEELPLVFDQDDEGVLGGRPNDPWYGGESHAALMRYVRSGWPKGRELLTSDLIKARLHTSMLRTPAYSFDVAGSHPSVPLAVAGDLQNMFSPQEEMIHTKPCLQLYSEQWNSCIVDAAAMRIRGAALLSHIEAIEAAGFPAELTLRYGCSTLSRTTRGKGVILDIRLKNAGEPLDLDRAALWLIHPGAFRRLVFSYFNRREGFEPLTTGYGTPQVRALRDVPGGIILPSANEHTVAYGRIEDAVEQVRRLIGTGLAALPAMRCDPLREYYVDNWKPWYEVDDA